ncbi:Clavaminate synthase-like protein [Aspergillus taichungensis]|uniref:Clavaminate synthase-like protein n=1 Tax=Aspergillus taichungensis TaxID=482145 RepID=A0A2J5HIM4_9EURO|nr:Clavaminate synthase-like protein [Aspergillus taichungensis]
MKRSQCLFHTNPWVRFQRYPVAVRFKASSSIQQQQQQQQQPRSNFSTKSYLHSYHPLQILKDASVAHFREQSFTPELPTILPRAHFQNLPAFERWFHPNTSRLNTTYLEQHGADAFVPLELTQPPTQSNDAHAEPSFRHFHAPLSLFLQWIRAAETEPQASQLYLAQCQLLDLPAILRDDFPTPKLVAQAGRGDVYDTNVWIGYPPTYTPLHRDPNPNLFVQLAGQKVVRLLAPDDGQAVFASVRRQLGQCSDRGAAAFRGEEMMQGQERALLEQAVWEDDPGLSTPAHGYEARLEAGDGMFIPSGWWHSIKGVGEGVTASVNWWFR